MWPVVTMHGPSPHVVNVAFHTRAHQSRQPVWLSTVTTHVDNNVMPQMFFFEDLFPDFVLVCLKVGVSKLGQRLTPFYTSVVWVQFPSGKVKVSVCLLMRTIEKFCACSHLVQAGCAGTPPHCILRSPPCCSLSPAARTRCPSPTCQSQRCSHSLHPIAASPSGRRPVLL